MLTGAYGDYAPTISMCEYRFLRYKDVDLDLNDKEHPAQLKTVSDAELESLLVTDQCQALNNHLETLQVNEIDSKARKLGAT